MPSTPTPRSLFALLVLSATVALLFAPGTVADAAGPTPPKAPAAGARPAAPDDFLGVSGRYLNGFDPALMSDAGVSVYRTLFHFSLAKRTEGGFYYWRELDELVRRAARNDLDLLPLLYGTPHWIHKGGAKPPIYDEHAIAEWQKLLRALVGRYGPGGLFWKLNPFLPKRPIRAWQIWNEPNLNKYWDPEPSPAGYVKLLKLSADAIRSVDPKATIVSAGVVADTEGAGIPGRRFLAAIASSQVARNTVDAIAYHPYAEGVGGVKRNLYRARRTIDRNGGEKIPLWVTEVGWGSDPALSDLLQKPGEEAQAKALRRTFAMLLRNRGRLGLERGLWYYWRDHFDPSCLWCRSAGLLRNSYRPKPALEAFAALRAPVPGD